MGCWPDINSRTKPYSVRVLFTDYLSSKSDTLSFRPDDLNSAGFRIISTHIENSLSFWRICSISYVIFIHAVHEIRFYCLLQMSAVSWFQHPDCYCRFTAALLRIWWNFVKTTWTCIRIICSIVTQQGFQLNTTHIAPPIINVENKKVNDTHRVESKIKQNQYYWLNATDGQNE